MNIKLSRLFTAALLVLAISGLVIAKGSGGKKAATLYKSAGEPVYTKFNINNISTWIKNDGETDINQNGNSGLVFPKGSNRAAVFQSGFLWGGKVDGQVRVGGSVYRQGLVPGYIKADGSRVMPEAADVRIYRVRRDFKEGSMNSEVADGDGATPDEVRAQYEKDWMEWPVHQGAPYEDVDGDKKYNPAIDIPGVPGADQTVFYVANDFDAAQTDFMYGSLPMGIEQQAVVWGYNATGALGNMLFRKFVIINKNAARKAFTDMFVSWWSDPDLGDAGDDYVGCDTTLSLGYCYNANATDATYNPFPPPAVGFDYFQGPIIPGVATDTAIFKGKYVPGKKNMPMTSFYFFINSDAIYTDPTQGNYERGTLGFYNLFQGKISTTGNPFIDPNTNLPTKFALAGNPVTRTGWLDGQLHPPGDRRLGMASGPFNMAYGDTQEIVLAEICAGATPGIDRLQAITLLKAYDVAAQIAYNRFFDLPRPPQAPRVTASALDGEVILVWGSDATAVGVTEGYANFGYEFQGYNIYQLPSATAQASEAVRLATFDVADDVKKVVDVVLDQGVEVQQLVAFGDDTGIKRSISIKTDALKAGLPLVNGSRYFFAITSYAYNPAPPFGPKILENPIAIIGSGGQAGLVPQKPNPGVRLNAKAGQAITAVRTAGVSDGIIGATVIDPAKVTGQKYTISFKDDPAHPGAVLWTLAQGSTVLLKDQANLSGDDDYLIVDGLQVKVQGPPPGIKHDDMFTTDDTKLWGWNWVKGTRRLTWAGGDGFHLEGFNGALGWISPRAIFRDGQMVVKAHEAKNVELRLAKVNFTGDYGPTLDPNDPNVSYGYRYMRASTAAAAKPEFAPFIINKVGNYSFQAFEKNVPLSAWNIDDPANPKRLTLGFLENNVTAGLVDGVYWPGSNGNITDNVSAATSTREWLFIFDEPYSETATADNKLALIGTAPQDPHRIMYTATWNRRGAVAFSPGATGDDVLRIFSNKVITASDKYEITAPSVSVSTELAKEDVKQINVFPNPYYGVNAQELNKYQRFVTFSHLPAKATIRIFNLAGQLVRILQKDSPEQFFRWDLQNQSQLPVASGLYIVHVDMPDLGETKILKVAIIQEQQLLDRF
jgi:hypothetical protein